MVTIQKSMTSEGHKVRVTFTMPAVESCDCLYLVGKFDEWDESVYRMQRVEDGTYSLTLELEPDRELRYRFRTCDGTWLHDSCVLHALDSRRAEISLVRTPPQHFAPD